MKRFNSILCATLLTLSISSAALGGQISGKSGQISGAPGQISGLSISLYSVIVDLLIP